MGLPFPKLILLPGMDGTGELFAELIRALRTESEAEVLRYPTDRFLSYEQLIPLIQSVFPTSEPFILVAESFSTPLAIRCAATKPPNLKGLVICAGFVTSPARGWRRFVYSLFAPLLFGAALPESAARHFLIGANASSSMFASVRAAVSSVKPKILSSRVRAILACDARAELAQVAVPILYLQAAQDRLVNASCLEEIRRIRPQTSVTVIDGPHLLFQREPRRTADVIVEFIQQLV